jgi:hypothetical protein
MTFLMVNRHHVTGFPPIYSERTLVYSEHRDETVDRQQTLSAKVNVSFEHTDPTRFDLIGVSLLGGSQGFGIKTARNHGWPWK